MTRERLPLAVIALLCIVAGLGSYGIAGAAVGLLVGLVLAALWLRLTPSRSARSRPAYAVPIAAGAGTIVVSTWLSGYWIAATLVTVAGAASLPFVSGAARSWSQAIVLGLGMLLGLGGFAFVVFVVDIIVFHGGFE